MSAIERPVPGLTIEQQPEAIVARMCLWAEARGEGPLGMLAVMHVIANRSKAERKTIGEVVLAPKQFSSFNPDDPNRVKLLDAPVLEPLGWGQADAIVRLWSLGLTEDPTQGSLNYYDPTVCSPVWGRGNPRWQEKVTIGRHVFGVAA